VKSATKSSPSNTSKSFAGGDSWDVPVRYLKGVGDRIGSLLNHAGIQTLWDLLLTLPRTYEDRTRFFSASEIQEAATRSQVVIGRALLGKFQRKRLGGRRQILEAHAEILSPHGDSATSFFERREIVFTWFSDPGGAIEKRFPEGSVVVFRGKPQVYRNHVQITHPELSVTEKDLPYWEFGGWVPVYTEIQGISTRVLRRILALALERPELRSIPDAFSETRRQELNIPPFLESLRELHFPRQWKPNPDSARPAGVFLKRVVFEELFMMALALHIRRAIWKFESLKNPKLIPQLKESTELLKKLTHLLPFRLTQDQQRTLEEILNDLALKNGSVAMHRLVQGDVGSGKTIVAFLAALLMIDSGYQVALMAPTEILADQHYNNFLKLFPNFGDQIVLLKGTLKNSEKVKFRDLIREGRIRFVIGTQALLTENTEFEKLGLVIIDEQHRFGVEQRIRLKSQSDDWKPHLMVMTATPIPRSLALTCYGDLEMSMIREKPPGRTPIKTYLLKQRQSDALVERLRKFLDEGRQIYIVYPLIEESEELDLKNATESSLDWKQKFPGFEIGLLHGRLKASEKDRVMNGFREGRSRILIATTVIEVGVDVPNASVILIENAERFGLSQLHQLRGRVGRGSTESFCILVGPDSPSPQVAERLRAIESSEDGFKIAEIDLEMRGPGEFLGRRQSGLFGFRVANLVRDVEWLEQARDCAKTILDGDPKLQDPEHQALRLLLQKWWSGKLEFTLSG
jgi:ATP-dependent DNA helicase RecG